MITTLASIAALPFAPLYAVPLAYSVYHPPRRDHHRAPADLGLHAEEHTVTVPGGSQRLHVWYVERKPDKVVVLGHGVGLSKSASLPHAAFLANAGYTVCLFDHRNHGASSQDRALWGLSDRFTDDVAAVVAHVRAMPRHAEAKLAVYGFSFSTFPSFYVLRRDQAQVDALVCDSGPGQDLPALWSRFLAAGPLPVPAPLRVGPAARGLEWGFSRVAVAMLKAEWPPPLPGRTAQTPALMLVGSDDVIMPVEQVERFAAHYLGARVVEIPGARHLGTLKADKERYTSAVLEFLALALA